MKNKLKSILLSGSVLVGSFVYAEQEKIEPEKTDAIHNTSEQSNMFERGTKCTTSAIRTGVDYLTKGVLFPVRAIGDAIEYMGAKTGQAVALTGDNMEIPEIGEYFGSMTRMPADLLFITLDTTGNLVQGAVNHPTNIMMTGIDSVATLPRSPKEAGKDFWASLKKTTSYDNENPTLNILRFFSFLYDAGVGLTVKGAHAAVEAKDVFVSGVNKVTGEKKVNNIPSSNTALEIVLLQEELKKSQETTPKKVSSQKVGNPASVVLVLDQNSR